MDDEDDIISTSAGLLSSTVVMVTFGRGRGVVDVVGVLISGVTGEDCEADAPVKGEREVPAAAAPPDVSAVGADDVLFTRSSDDSSESFVSELSPWSKLWLAPPLTPLSLSRNFKRDKGAETGTVIPDRERAYRSRFLFPLEFILEMDPLESKRKKYLTT